MPFDRYAVEQFLYREARLADEQRLDDWLTLWAEDALYWVPCNQDDVDPARQLSIIYDDYARLKLRVARITKTGMAWTQEPRSRLRRLVSNIEIYDGPDGLIQTFSNFRLTELRANRRDPVEWIGRTEHRLRPHGDDFRLAYKKVMLINNDHEMTQLSCMV
jgi:3-phenylpropionate/cinnamic acid dioxygenase small subunit